MPIPETAAALVAAVTPRSGPLVDVLAEALGAPARRPRPARRVAPRGAPAAPAHDLPGRRTPTAPSWTATTTSRRCASGCARACRRAWPTPPPRSSATGCGPSRRAGSRATIALPGTNQAVRAHPALVDEGDAVGVAVLESPAAQEAAMVLGTRRLLGLLLPSPARAAQAALTTAQRLTLAGAATRAGDSRRDRRRRGRRGARPARRARRRPGLGRGGLRAAAGRGGRAARADRGRRAAPRRRGPRRRPGGGAAPGGSGCPPRSAPPTTTSPPSSTGSSTRASPRRPAPRDCPTSSAGCAPPPTAWTACPDALARDRERQGVLDELEAAYAARVAALPAGAAAPPALREARWMLEELRAGGAASAKRVRRALAEAAPPR